MKKTLALVLAVVLAFGMCSMAFAATKDVGYIEPTDLYWVTGTATTDSWDYDELRADTEIKIWLNPKNFKTDDTSAGVPFQQELKVRDDVITESQLRNQKLTVRRNVSKGGDLLVDVSFSSDTMPSGAYGAFKIADPKAKSAYISVEFVEHFVSVNSKDFDYKIYLYLDGKKQEKTEFVLTGTMENEPVEVYEDEDYVSSEDGYVVKAEDYVRGIEMYLGDGVSAWLNMFKGTKYYGTARQEISSADDAVMNQYPEIESVYVLRTVNVKGSGTKVTFELNDTYYVYNEDGNFVGTTAEELPYSDKYYLANARITMGTGTDTGSTEEPTQEPDDGDDNGDINQPDMGGDDSDALDGYENVNDNPGTGVSGIVNVAIVAGVIALAAAGAVVLKK